MSLRRKLTETGVLAALALLVYFGLPAWPGVVPVYDRCIFYPFQWVRGLLLGWIPVSAGDLLYIAMGIWVLVTLVRWVKYIASWRVARMLLALSVIRTVKTLLCIYLLFVAGWGANYYKPALRQSWHLAPPAADTSSDTAAVQARRAKALADLTHLNEYLVLRLNSYAPYYRAMPLSELNRRARRYYGAYTDSKVAPWGLNIKPTIYGYFLDRLGIEGYYNPFTGEGQIVSTLPAFTMPFLLCHEMAHQAGIAAEEDANLLAYALCTASNDSTFRYSAYLNLWLYASTRLYRRDSLLASRYEAQLNPLTTAQLDTLENLSALYQNEMARKSSNLFDSYLKLQDQKDGIHTYGNVATSAWMLEQQRAGKPAAIIVIP